MPEDQTEFVEKPEPESRFAKVSIRGWIALILTITVCLIGLQSYVFALTKITGVQVKVEEPLYSAFLIALGFYFGQKKT